MKNSSQLLKFTEACMHLATEYVPLYSSPCSIRRALGLERLPHFTTVQKAFQRLAAAIWRVLQRISASLLRGDGVAALDASGWDRSHASCYYTHRVKLQTRSLKTTLLVDTQAQTVLDVHLPASMTRRSLPG